LETATSRSRSASEQHDGLLLPTAKANEVIFVHEVSGVLETTSATFRTRTGDYIVRSRAARRIASCPRVPSGTSSLRDARVLSDPAAANLKPVRAIVEARRTTTATSTRPPELR